jgi:DNA (cytosine-5)-methyltransferase 1
LSGEQSSLFFEAIRIIKEMREATNGAYPRFIAWENVPGAFSSNGGADFQQVLTGIVRIAEPEAPEVPAAASRPAGDAWLGDGWSVAYRVIDAAAWVPQRRKRIYLVADFGSERAADRVR